MDELSEKIRELRRKKDFTQQELADTLGVKILQVQRYEKGILIPPIEKMKKLGEILNYDFINLLSNNKEGNAAKNEILNSSANLYFMASKKALEIVIAKYLSILLKNVKEESILDEIHVETEKQLIELASTQ